LPRQPGLVQLSTLRRQRELFGELLRRSFRLPLVNCSYCFGCVGLSGKDFYVLNEPYERRDYFALTERLAKELKL